MSFSTRLLIGLVLVCPFAIGQPAPYPQRPEVQAYIHELAVAQGFQAEELAKLFAGIQPDPRVLDLAAPAPVSRVKNWRVYRSRFLDRATIRAGAQFWRQHAASLARAEKEFGVSAEIIAGILGVETLYGRNMGRFPVLDTLVTLSFDYPEAPNRDLRIALFRQQLSEYLIWCRDTHQDVHAFTGSYTGAIGIPQFLPGSIRACGVDFDGDGRIDLRASAVDAIGSVARFLKEHGWQRGEPVFWRVAGDARSRRVLASRADGDPALKHCLGDLLQTGLRPIAAASATRAKWGTKVLLVDLPTPDRATEYRIGFQNFYVITRYNRSFFYAMAVSELGRAVKAAAVGPKRPPTRSSSDGESSRG
jgi:membrane-bound lytic murein transglycosylase B